VKKLEQAFNIFSASVTVLERSLEFFGRTLKLYFFKLLIRLIYLTLPNQFNIPFPNPARGHQRPPSEALKFLFFEGLRCDARRCIYKVTKIGLY